MNNQLIDNNQYNLISALANNLEAYNAYQKYAKDGNAQLWNQLAQFTAQSVQLLQQEMSRTIGQTQTTGQGQSQTMGQNQPMNQAQNQTATTASQPSNFGQQNYTDSNSTSQSPSNTSSNQPPNSAFAQDPTQRDELTMPDPDQKTGYANENYSPVNQ